MNETDVLIIDTRLNNIINYIKDNPQSDPNAYEMNDVMFSYARIKNNNINNSNLDSKFNRMMDYRLNQMKNNDNELECQNLYNYFKGCLEYVDKGISLGDENLQRALNSLCGVNLYCHQRVRELNNQDGIIYDNTIEYLTLGNSLQQQENSDLLKNSGIKGVVDLLKDEVDSMYNKSIKDFTSSKAKKI